MLSGFASNLSANPALSPVNSGASAVLGGKGQSAVLSGGGSGSGSERGGFSKSLNSSIKNSGNDSAGNPVNNTGAATQSVNAGVKDNTQVDAPTVNNNNNLSNSANTAHKDKSKNGNTKNNAYGTSGQIFYFIGNSNIILQPVSVKKEDIAGGGTNAKSGNKNSNVAASSYYNKIDLSAGTENVSGKMTDLYSENSISNAPAAGIASSDAVNSGSGIENSLKNIENQIEQNNTVENKANANDAAAVSSKSADSNNANAGTNTLLKDTLANALNLTALNVEEKSLLSGAGAGQNNTAENKANANDAAAVLSKSADSNNANAPNNAALLPDNGKITGFTLAGSSQDAGAGLASQASNGNFAGLNLSGGAVASGPEDSGNEPPGSVAVNSVMFMLGKNIQSTTLTLTPPSLGSVKINISLNNLNPSVNSLNSSVSNGSITINMFAQNEAAKNILQSSSDSLQNALKNQGFSSINLNISSGSGYNNQTGNNANEPPKNPFIGSHYNGSSFANGSSGEGLGSSALNTFTYRNPDALIDYFV